MRKLGDTTYRVHRYDHVGELVGGRVLEVRDKDLARDLADVIGERLKGVEIVRTTITVCQTTIQYGEGVS